VHRDLKVNKVFRVNEAYKEYRVQQDLPELKDLREILEIHSRYIKATHLFLIWIVT